MLVFSYPKFSKVPKFLCVVVNSVPYSLDVISILKTKGKFVAFLSYLIQHTDGLISVCD